MKILHISTHLGGGVGRFLSDSLLSLNKGDFTHEIVLLEEPSNRKFFDECKRGGIRIEIAPSQEKLSKIMLDADVVVIHWWHHPIMASFLANFPKIPIRLALMSHISGCHYPILKDSFLDRFDWIFFTSNYSLENKNWKENYVKSIKEKSSIVYGLGRLLDIKKDCYTIDEIFKVGYVGTLSKSKLHPEFAIICKAIIEEIPNASFTMVGDKDQSFELIEETRKLGIQNHFDFIGFTDCVQNELKKFDVFGYPLNSKHFGTTENALLEALSIGLPVVTFNQNTEKYIIDSGTNGMLANSASQYVKYIVELYKSEDLRMKLGNNAYVDVRKKFSFDSNINLFQSKLFSLLAKDKRIFMFTDIIGEEPNEWFLEHLGNDSEIFKKDLSIEENRKAFKEYILDNYILRAISKSSIKHFYKYFSEDNHIKRWYDILLELESEELEKRCKNIN